MSEIKIDPAAIAFRDAMTRLTAKIIDQWEASVNDLQRRNEDLEHEKDDWKSRYELKDNSYQNIKLRLKERNEKIEQQEKQLNAFADLIINIKERHNRDLLTDYGVRNSIIKLIAEFEAGN